MTGRYLIYTPIESARDERRFDKAWRRFATVCRSLHRDGLSYDVQLNLADDTPHVLITASGKAVTAGVVGKISDTSAAPSALIEPGGLVGSRMQLATWLLLLVADGQSRRP